MGVWYSMTVSDSSSDAVVFAHLTMINRDTSASSVLSSTMGWDTSLAHCRPGATCTW